MANMTPTAEHPTSVQLEGAAKVLKPALDMLGNLSHEGRVRVLAACALFLRCDEDLIDRLKRSKRGG